MEWLSYLLKVSACMALFYACYHFFLRRLTFFSTNRMYLLSTLLISFAIPMLTLQIEKIREAPSELRHTGPPVSEEVTVMPGQQNMNSDLEHQTAQSETYSWGQMLFIAYAIVALTILTVFALRIISLLRHTLKPKTRFGRLKVVYKPDGFTNCSFFNYVFVDQQDLTGHDIEILLHHENIHASKYHSVDKLLVILGKIVLWFNPFIYLYDKSLEQLHEYDADWETSLSIGNAAYARLLLNISVKQNNIPMVQNFANNPLKERIEMLFTNQSKRMKKLMYLTALPLLAVLLWSFSVSYVYKDPIARTKPNPAAIKKHLLVADTPKYRQKIKMTPQYLQAKNKNAAWRNTAEYKRRHAEAYRIGNTILSGVVKDNPDVQMRMRSPLLFVTDKKTYIFDKLDLDEKIIKQINGQGMVGIKVGIIGINKSDPYLSIVASEITKEGKLIYKQPAPVQSAFSYEANKVRFTDGEITKVTDYSANYKEIEVTASGHKFFVKIGKEQVDVKELNDFKKGDPVRLRFVHEVKSGAKSYSINDWVSISKNIREYGVKNKKLFNFFYEKVPAEDKITYSASGSVDLDKNRKFLSI